MSRNSITEEELKGLLKNVSRGKKGTSVKEHHKPVIFPDEPQDLMFDKDDYLFIPGEVYSSKNSTQIKITFVERSKWKVLVKGVWRFVRPYVAKSDNAKSYQTGKEDIYRALASDFKVMYEGVGFPIFVEMIFIRRTRGIWDFNNLSQQVCDSMEQNGWVPGDDTRHMFAVPPMPPLLAYYVDKTNPGVYIRVLK